MNREHHNLQYVNTGTGCEEQDYRPHTFLETCNCHVLIFAVRAVVVMPYNRPHEEEIGQRDTVGEKDTIHWLPCVS